MKMKVLIVVSVVGAAMSMSSFAMGEAQKTQTQQKASVQAAVTQLTQPACVVCCKDAISVKEKCPEQPKKAAAVKHKKKAAPKVAAAQYVPKAVSTLASPVHAAPGCVEIYFPKMHEGDIGVKGHITSSVDHDIKNDSCTGIKAEGEADFKPLSNELCEKALPIVCDTARQEAVVGQRAWLKFSFFTKPGTAYVLRLPAHIATDDSETTAVGLVQGLLTKTPGSTEAYRETVQYAKTNMAMMSILSSCYEGGVVNLPYEQSDVSPLAACRVYLHVPRTDWKGP